MLLAIFVSVPGPSALSSIGKNLPPHPPPPPKVHLVRVRYLHALVSVLRVSGPLAALSAAETVEIFEVKVAGEDTPHEHTLSVELGGSNQSILDFLNTLALAQQSLGNRSCMSDLGRRRFQKNLKSIFSQVDSERFYREISAFQRHNSLKIRTTELGII